MSSQSSAGASADAAPTSLLRDRNVMVGALIATVVALGFGLVVPVLPLFARDFGVGLFAVTAVVSVFAGVRLVSNMYTGALADRIGQRSAIGSGALIVAVSSLAISSAPNYWALLAFRGLGGFGSALFFNALLALIVGSVRPNQRGRAVGMLQGAFLFGISIGPSVGGILAEPLGLRWPFVIYAAFCALAGIVAFTLLPKPEAATTVTTPGGPEGEPPLAGPAPAPRGLGQMWSASRQLVADPAFAAALVMMGASRWAATGVRFSLIPVFADEVVGADARMIGFALTLAALTHLALVWPSGRLIDTRGRKSLGAPAYFAFAAIAVGIGFAVSIPAFLLAMALYGVGTGLTSVVPPAVVGDVAPPERTGTAIGVLNTAGDLGSVLGPLVSGVLAQAFGYAWGFGASAVLLAVAGLWALRMRETLVPERSDTGAPATAR
jgi:DHA1 family multidrug resistance protein-like MFS transporter